MYQDDASIFMVVIMPIRNISREGNAHEEKNILVKIRWINEPNNYCIMNLLFDNTIHQIFYKKLDYTLDMSSEAVLNGNVVSAPLSSWT